MRYHNEKSDFYERLSSIRMSPFHRRKAIESMQRAERIADLILAAANVYRRVSAGLSRMFRPGGQRAG